MFPSLIEIVSKTAEKNSAQTNRETNRHYENNGHLAVNQLSYFSRMVLHRLSSLHAHHLMLAVEGGAIANLYAVLIARHKALPEVKNKGLANLPQLVVFQSERV